MDRVVDGQAANPLGLLGGIVAPARQHGIDRQKNRLMSWNLAPEAGSHFGDVAVHRLHDIGAVLQVARVLGRNASDTARVVGTDDETALTFEDRFKQPLHRRREGVEIDDLVHHVLDIRSRQRLKVRDEVGPLPREIRFSLLVEAAMNGIVGALEQPVLAVGDELDCVWLQLRLRQAINEWSRRREVLQISRRNHN